MPSREDFRHEDDNGRGLAAAQKTYYNKERERMGDRCDSRKLNVLRLTESVTGAG
jgi:hypothetical protein